MHMPRPTASTATAIGASRVDGVGFAGHRRLHVDLLLVAGGTCRHPR